MSPWYVTLSVWDSLRPYLLQIEDVSSPSWGSLRIGHVFSRMSPVFLDPPPPTRTRYVILRLGTSGDNPYPPQPGVPARNTSCVYFRCRTLSWASWYNAG